MVRTMRLAKLRSSAINSELLRIGDYWINFLKTSDFHSFLFSCACNILTISSMLTFDSPALTLG